MPTAHPHSEGARSVRVRSARPEDLGTLRLLLESAKLDHADLEKFLDNVLVAETGGKIAGMIGLETYGSTGLLRSAIVGAAFRGAGIGRMLVAKLEERARRQKITALILLTTDAAGYFSRLGFSAISRSEIQGDILRSNQFTGSCPASATVMQKRLPHRR